VTPPSRMKVVVALGGNALLRRDQPLTAENQRDNASRAAEALAEVAENHTLTVTHGNGPQIGLLALQSEEGDPEQAQPLDVLGAQTDGMIGHLLAQRLRSSLPEKEVVVLLTQVRVDANDEAFQAPTKPIGRVYAQSVADRLARERGWTIVRDGDGWRRAVPSPRPQQILEIGAIRLLVDAGTVVVCGGGGGIPVVVGSDRAVHGVEAVVDKDATTGMIAAGIGADLLLLLTDVDGLYEDFGTPHQRRIAAISVGAALDQAEGLPSGSMGPKLRAAAEFVRDTGGRAAIGCLEQALGVVEGRAGTQIEPDV